MFIRCHGARGSIPVSGKGYLRYGGDTTCLEILSRSGEIIIVDAGSGIRRLGNRLLKEERFNYNILFTHSHWDHILGFPFFKPIYDERCTISLMGCSTTQGDIHKLLSKTMSAPYFPYPFEKLKATILYANECKEVFSIDSIEIDSIPLSHPNVGMGFRFTEQGKRFVFLTDNELGYRHRGGMAFEDYLAFSRGADLLIHDAEFTPEEYEQKRSWGHSCYTDALELALAAGVSRFGLFHHNQDREDEAQDEIVERCREIVRERGASLDCFGICQEDEITL
ncbi:MAG: MBL fold metallo-hydrolase [Desulfobacteraceae bacterium]|jgi:phosphoribosyl 1,2-cyclic phosphodiesterase